MGNRYFLVTFRLNHDSREDYFDSLCEVFSHHTDLSNDKVTLDGLEVYMNERMGNPFKCTIFNVSEITGTQYTQYREEIEYPF